MTSRTVRCDFCGRVLTGHCWHCPARDFDYTTPRTNLEGIGPPVDGSIGAWLACDHCAVDVRDGNRERLLKRSVFGNYGNVIGSAVGARHVADLRELHDQFWTNREGPPVMIGAEQLALIASDPAYKREMRFD